MDSRLGGWLALGAFAGSVESSVIVGFLPDIAAETGVRVGEAGLLVLGYSLAYGFATPVLSTLFGRHHRRRIVVGAEALFGLAAILVALSPGFPMIFAARTLLAVGRVVHRDCAGNGRGTGETGRSRPRRLHRGDRRIAGRSASERRSARCSATSPVGG